MSLPVLNTPTFELILPSTGKKVKFRPFLVKEQRNLMMALESDESDTIERNVKQILTNCTLTENIDIDSLPVIDIEYYFLNLRARSVGEVVENDYICNNTVDDKECGNKMKASFNILELKVQIDPDSKEIIQLTDKISIKMKYPEYSIINKLKNKKSEVDMAFEIIADSIEYVFDGEQYYYAKETPKKELSDFIDSLNQEQFSKIENFFNNLPKMKKEIDMTCSKCGFNHHIMVEGLEDFFG